MYRKILCVLCVLTMAASLAACGDKSEEVMPLNPETSSETSTEIASSEVGSAVADEVTSEPEIQPVMISENNIYDCPDMTFEADNLQITLDPKLDGATHNVLFLGDQVEVPVMIQRDGANHMVYNIVVSEQDLPERQMLASIGTTKIYVDAYMPDEFGVELLSFADNTPVEPQDEPMTEEEIGALQEAIKAAHPGMDFGDSSKPETETPTPETKTQESQETPESQAEPTTETTEPTEPETKPETPAK